MVEKKKKSTGHRAGKGSHGGMTKAGKIKYFTTPKVEARKRKRPHPSLRNKQNYIKREKEDKPVGQPDFRR